MRNSRSIPAWPFLCGIASSLLYVVADVTASWWWADYQYSGQAISELSAVGAPTRPAWLVFAVVYDLLLVALAWGVYTAAERRRTLQLTALFLAAIAAVGMVWAPLFPMHARGTPIDNLDRIHVILAAATVLLTLAAMMFGAAGFGRRFGAFSLVSVVVMLAAGVRAALDGAAVGAGLPTPGLGIYERVSVYSYLLWVLVLSVAFWRARRHDRTTSAFGDRPRYAAA